MPPLPVLGVEPRNPKRISRCWNEGERGRETHTLTRTNRQMLGESEGMLLSDTHTHTIPLLPLPGGGC